MPPGSTKPEKVTLLLQGGGALGAYQAGVYAALEKAGYRPRWVAGISIGAINGAIIAGNRPGEAAEKLRTFWTRISESVTPFPFVEEWMETAFNQTAAATTLMFGAPGFFKPRASPPYTAYCSDPAELSYYDTAPLDATLKDLVCFERINDRAAEGHIRLSVGAVGVMDGNFAYFDSKKQTIGPEHVMASGALPPGLPAIWAEYRKALPDGRTEPAAGWFWDGGLVSNTPLQYVVDEDDPDDILAFQVDLFPSKGPMPRNLFDVEERQKDIRFSSRTRLNTDMARLRQKIAAAAKRLTGKLPPELRNDPDLDILRCQAAGAAMTLVHFIYKRKHASGYAKDYEFSRSTVLAHWDAGFGDAERTLRHPRWLNRVRPEPGDVTVFDCSEYEAGTAAGPPSTAKKEKRS